MKSRCSLLIFYKIQEDRLIIKMVFVEAKRDVVTEKIVHQDL